MPKVAFQTRCSISDSEMERHRAFARSFNLPPPKLEPGKLAIVGGGGSVLGHVETLRAWDGPIWAANGAWNWCADHRIDAIFVSASPAAERETPLVGISRAVLADQCAPELFEALKGADISVFLADCGPTSVCAAMGIAVETGFHEIHLFGCEGNYGQTTHAYYDFPSDTDIVVKSGGVNYRTNVGYLLQCQMLATMIRAVPAAIKEYSGGLLGSLVVDIEDWDVLEMQAAA